MSLKNAEDTPDVKEISKTDAAWFIFALCVAVLLWTAMGQICDLLFKHQKKSTQIYIYSGIIVMSVVILYVVSQKDSRFIGFAP
jgi:Na+/melibiose symporter-like transporter